jgi:hypothetical protein
VQLLSIITSKVVVETLSSHKEEETLFTEPKGTLKEE